MIGMTTITKEGCHAEIIKYEGWDNITVFFKETNNTAKCSHQAFKNGTIKNRMHKSVNGVGFLGNTSASYECKDKQSYSIWHGMISRCYDDKNYKNFKTYSDCTVCDEWFCFENFEKWYNDNFYKINDEKMCLDKDILTKGNKIYSPETCCFVPSYINTLFINTKSARGNLPVGVYLVKGSICRYYSCISKNGKQGKIGYSNTKEDAFYMYKNEKEKYIKEIAEKYKNYIPEKLYNAMYAYKIEITD